MHTRMFLRHGVMISHMGETNLIHLTVLGLQDQRNARTEMTSATTIQAANTHKSV